jgi:hypothetical protein
MPGIAGEMAFCGREQVFVGGQAGEDLPWKSGWVYIDS